MRKSHWVGAEGKTPPDTTNLQSHSADKQAKQSKAERPEIETAVSLEPQLPFEFVVRGTAISSQGSTPSIEAWKDAIRAAARATLPEGSWLITEPVAVTIFIFPGAVMRGDVDNRVKPILDAMVRCVYGDDELVERIVVQKFEPGRVFAFQNPTEVLLRALEAEEPIVYIRITDDLYEELSLWSPHH